jgi:hypothetical protein
MVIWLSLSGHDKEQLCFILKGKRKSNENFKKQNKTKQKTTNGLVVWLK